MKTRLYNQVHVLHVSNSESGRVRAVIFYDSLVHKPQSLLERMFNGCRWVGMDFADGSLQSYVIHHRGRKYRANCTANVIEMLQAHKGRRYVYLCA